MSEVLQGPLGACFARGVKGCSNQPQQPHKCPYATDINDDDQPCNCCDECELWCFDNT